MLTTPKANLRETKTIARIKSMLSVRLGEYAAAIQVSIENTVIVLRGELPSDDLKRELLPAVRQAGVLSRVMDRVRVPA